MVADLYIRYISSKIGLSSVDGVPSDAREFACDRACHALLKWVSLDIECARIGFTSLAL